MRLKPEARAARGAQQDDVHEVGGKFAGQARVLALFVGLNGELGFQSAHGERWIKQRASVRATL
jgi:hypothetical protein